MRYIGLHVKGAPKSFLYFLGFYRFFRNIGVIVYGYIFQIVRPLHPDISAPDVIKDFSLPSSRLKVRVFIEASFIFPHDLISSPFSSEVIIISPFYGLTVSTGKNLMKNSSGTYVSQSVNSGTAVNWNFLPLELYSSLSIVNKTEFSTSLTLTVRVLPFHSTLYPIRHAVSPRGNIWACYLFSYMRHVGGSKSICAVWSLFSIYEANEGEAVQSDSAEIPAIIDIFLILVAPITLTMSALGGTIIIYKLYGYFLDGLAFEKYIFKSCRHL